MENRLKIRFRHSVGNLHIRPEGEFNGTGAWALIKTIHRRYNGFGRVFVNTAALEPIHPSGAALFKAHMSPKIMPLENLYLKGEKGFEIGPDGARVIICKKNQDNLKKRCRAFGPRRVH